MQSTQQTHLAPEQLLPTIFVDPSASLCTVIVHPCSHSSPMVFTTRRRRSPYRRTYRAPEVAQVHREVEGLRMHNRLRPDLQMLFPGRVLLEPGKMMVCR